MRFLICFSLLAGLFLFSPSLLAQKIVEVRVRGNERLNDAAVLQYLSSKPGQNFVRTQVRDDLRSLFNSGLFKDVRIDLEQSNQGLVLVVFVEEKDYIQSLGFKGLRLVSKADLEKALNLKPPFLWDDVLVRQSIDSIRKLYRDKGYYLVTVKPEVVIEDGGKTLVFVIDEGRRVVVQKVYFQGNQALSSRLLRESIFTQPGSFWRDLSRMGLFDEDLIVQIDTRRIQLEYMKRGFANVQVDSPSITFTPDRSNVIVSFSIEEGERFNVGEISFSGDLDFIDDAESLRASLKSQRGQIWNYLTIQEDINKIQDLYGDEGYAYVNINPVWTVSPDNPKELNIDFRIDKGSIVYFGNIDFIGNYETLDRVIRRELLFSEGELFNLTNYRKSQKNLEKLGYFSNVKFIQKDILSENRMDVLIEVEERQTGSMNFGATFSS
ncbi:MAG: outer membrane protein assembly factor BamA, partial [Bdellovibrionota bacterium]